MLGKEIFLVDKRPKAAHRFGATWYYPNTYEVGMAGLGYQLVWSLLEADEDLLVRRGFSDIEEPGASESDLFGFTVSWELDFINVLDILVKHKINPLASRRADDEPIVFGGGPVLSANPEPYADFFDVILLGDAESVIPEFLDCFKKTAHIESRKERLMQMAQVPGVYIPSLYQFNFESPCGSIKEIAPLAGAPDIVRKRIFTAPPDYAAHSVMLAPDTAFGDMFLIEVVRSCPQECRFCLASFLTRPFRAANVDTLVEKIDLGLQHTSKIGLLGPSVTEHPQFEALAARLSERKQARVSVASVRADSLSESILSMLKLLGQKSVTIAIESGSERLRSIMKKNLSEVEIFHAVDLIDRAGLQSVKFYGIAGLPHETQDDLDETIRLMQDLKKAHKRLRLVFGVSSFVPKAQTPFQWAGRDRECKEKLDYLRKHLSQLGIEVRPESHNWSDIQALLSRGDRRLTPVLLSAAEEGGKIGSWKKALRRRPETCPDLDFYAFRQIHPEEILPWSHLCESEKTSYLRKHLDSAQSFADADSQLKLKSL